MPRGPNAPRAAARESQEAQRQHQLNARAQQEAQAQAERDAAARAMIGGILQGVINRVRK
jgi:hypothetical protein